MKKIKRYRNLHFKICELEAHEKCYQVNLRTGFVEVCIYSEEESNDGFGIHLHFTSSSFKFEAIKIIVPLQFLINCYLPGDRSTIFLQSSSHLLNIF